MPHTGVERRIETWKLTGSPTLEEQWDHFFLVFFSFLGGIGNKGVLQFTVTVCLTSVGRAEV